MPIGGVEAQQGAIGLLIQTSSREGERLDGVVIQCCVVSTNGDEMGGSDVNRGVVWDHGGIR